MTTLRGLAAAAAFAGAAVGLACPAWANDFSGTYTMAEDSGRSGTWTVTPCGPGYVNVSAGATSNWQAYSGQAHLVGGQWTMTVQRPDTIVCQIDNSTWPGTTAFTWDSSALSDSLTGTPAAVDGPCGDPVGIPLDPGGFTLTKTG